jgi:hypothetical protein
MADTPANTSLQSRSFGGAAAAQNSTQSVGTSADHANPGANAGHDLDLSMGYRQMWQSIAQNDATGFAQGLAAIPNRSRRLALHQVLPAQVAQSIFVTGTAASTPNGAGASSLTFLQPAYMQVALRGAPEAALQERDSLFAPGKPACVAAALGHSAALTAMLTSEPRASVLVGDKVVHNGDLHVFTPTFWAAYFGAVGCLDVLKRHAAPCAAALMALGYQVHRPTVTWLVENEGVKGAQFEDALVNAIDNSPRGTPEQRTHEKLEAAATQLEGEDFTSATSDDDEEQPTAVPPTPGAAGSDLNHLEELGSLVRDGKVDLSSRCDTAPHGWLQYALQEKRWDAAMLLLELGAPLYVTMAAEVAEDSDSEDFTAPNRRLIEQAIKVGPLALVRSFVVRKAKLQLVDLKLAMERAGDDAEGQRIFGLLYRHGCCPTTLAEARDLFSKALLQRRTTLSHLMRAHYLLLRATHTEAASSVRSGLNAQCQELAYECDHDDEDDFDTYFTGNLEADLGYGDLAGKLKPLAQAARAAKGAVRTTAKFFGSHRAKPKEQLKPSRLSRLALRGA